jgi:hypothetical protein
MLCSLGGRANQILERYVKQVVVSNPLKTKAIAEAKIKTDKVDAEVLAQLLRCNFLPVVSACGEHRTLVER